MLRFLGGLRCSVTCVGYSLASGVLPGFGQLVLPFCRSGSVAGPYGPMSLRPLFVTALLDYLLVLMATWW